MKKERKKKSGLSRSEQVRLNMQRMRAARNDLEVLPYHQSSRRKKCRVDLLQFIETYLKGWFPLPHSPDQIKTIRRLEHTALRGGNSAIARPRGTGKTQQTKAAALWSALYRHRRYILPFAATAKMARKNFANMSKALAQNSLLAEDWPEICLPIRAAYMRPNKSRYITVNGEPTQMECSATKLVFPYCPGVCLDAKQDGVVIMECAGVLEAARGLQHDTPTGETLRPDFAIGDDIQTKSSARSPSQCQTRIETIRGDFKHMAGPNKDLALVINATVIEKGDAADQLLDRDKHPEFEGERQRMVYEFPKAADLWKTYTELRKAGFKDGDKGAAANAFYKANRAAMDDGAVVGWDHGYSEKKGEISAIQAAYNIIADDGEAVFWAECQNQPIERVATQYELTADTILSRLTGIPRLISPPGTAHIIAAADVNFVGLNHVILTGRPDHAAHVAHYGKHPENDVLIDRKAPRGLTDAQAIANAIGQLAVKLNDTILQLDGKPRYIDALFIDCGYMRSTVLKAISAIRLPMKIYAVRGTPSSRFKIKKDAIKSGTEWQVIDFPEGRVFEINSDYWREQSQRAFLLSPGTPGSISLYGDTPEPHRRLAAEIAGEKLLDKTVSAAGNTFYKWTLTPGTPNDLGDATTYAFAALNLAGADTRNAETAWRQPAPPENPAQPHQLGPANNRTRKPTRTPSVHMQD